MKTIEQKARAYDEALEKAKALYGSSEPMSGCYVIIETLFPELAESEDEKVRKELIKHLKEGAEGYEPAGGSSDYQRWLAWLERQGDYANFRDKAQVGDRITKNEDGVLVNLSQLKRMAKTSEKQGEQIDIANKEYWRGYREGKKEILDKYAEIEKQGEQKPVDKVEPKFKKE